MPTSQTSLHTPFRIGHGFDRHRLAPIDHASEGQGQGRPLIIGGVALDSPIGPIAHSDGDALLHAITDAVCGAAGLPDIGQLFSNTDPTNESKDSMIILRAVAQSAHNAGWSVVNLDATVLLEQPKLAPHKRSMIKRIAEALSIDESQVNVKGKTGEGVGPVGRLEAIEAHAVVLCANNSNPER